MSTEIFAKMFTRVAVALGMYKMDGPKPVGWTRPHQGAREIARRRRQMQKAALKAAQKEL